MSVRTKIKKFLQGSNLRVGRYSPNNIRRVVLGSRSVGVSYHIPVERKDGSMVLNDRLYLDDDDFASLKMLREGRNYRPIMLDLIDPMCSSLEEIVIVGDSYSCREYMDLNILCTGLSGAEDGGNISMLLRRFGRMRYVMSYLFEGPDYLGVLNWIGAERDYLWYSLGGSSNGKVINLKNRFWHNAWGCRSSSYPIDLELDEYFRGVQKVEGRKLDANASPSLSGKLCGVGFGDIPFDDEYALLRYALRGLTLGDVSDKVFFRDVSLLVEKCGKSGVVCADHERFKPMDYISRHLREYLCGYFKRLSAMGRKMMVSKIFEGSKRLSIRGKINLDRLSKQDLIIVSDAVLRGTSYDDSYERLLGK